MKPIGQRYLESRVWSTYGIILRNYSDPTGIQLISIWWRILFQGSSCCNYAIVSVAQKCMDHNDFPLFMAEILQLRVVVHPIPSLSYMFSIGQMIYDDDDDDDDLLIYFYRCHQHPSTAWPFSTPGWSYGLTSFLTLRLGNKNTGGVGEMAGPPVLPHNTTGQNVLCQLRHFWMLANEI